MIKILPLGGADEVGASCFYFDIAGTGIILDSGIHPQRKGIEALPDFDLLSELPADFVFISHAHQDHIGALPFLIKRYPHLKVFATPQTIQLAELTLHNAVNIVKREIPGDSSIKPYSHEEIDLLIRSINDVPYNDVLYLAGLRHDSNSKIEITFSNAGHILGSSSILIEHEDYKIFYSGDINLSSQEIMLGAQIASNKVDTLMLESTYGASDSDKLGTWESESKRFTKIANEIIEKGGSILIPIFALGKTQEILALIYRLMEKGSLTDTNVYTGGLGKKINSVYDTHRYIVRRKNVELELRKIQQLNFYEVTDLNDYKKKPGIMLASSGMMMENTTSFNLANYWLRQKSFAIFFVGYLDPGTPGFKISTSKLGDKIQLIENDEQISINRTIEKFNFPTHSKREGLLQIVRQLKPDRVILVHGDSNARDWIGYQILKSNPNVKVHLAATNKWIDL